MKYYKTKAAVNWEAYRRIRSPVIACMCHKSMHHRILPKAVQLACRKPKRFLEFIALAFYASKMR